MLLLPRWLWLNHIPAGLELSPEQQAEVRQRVRSMGPAEQRRHGLGRKMLVRMAPGIALLSILFVVWIFWLVGAKLSPGRFVLVNVTGVLLFQAAMWFIIAWSINRAMAPLVWRALNQLGVRVCEACGYILEGLPRNQPNCPECGATLHPPMEANNTE
jgi:hypothetical protein